MLAVTILQTVGIVQRVQSLLFLDKLSFIVSAVAAFLVVFSARGASQHAFCAFWYDNQSLIDQAAADIVLLWHLRDPHQFRGQYQRLAPKIRCSWIVPYAPFAWLLLSPLQHRGWRKKRFGCR